MNTNNLETATLFVLRDYMSADPKLDIAESYEDACWWFNEWISDSSYEVVQEEGFTTSGQRITYFQIEQLNHQSQRKNRYGCYSKKENAFKALFDDLFFQAERHANDAGHMLAISFEELLETVNELRENEGLKALLAEELL